MEETKLIAKKRDRYGSSNARRIRKAGALPAVIYGAEKETVSVEIDMHAFEKILHHSASESIIIDIELEGEGDLSVLVKDVQHHPVEGGITHADLFRIVAGQLIEVEIALELVGEPAGVNAGGVLDQIMHTIAIECLPQDLVASITLDVSGLEIGDTMCVSDLNLGSESRALVEDDAIVASVAAPRAEEEPEEEEGLAEGAEAAEGAEPEVISEKKADEEAD